MHRVSEAASGAPGSIQCPGCREYVVLTVEAPRAGCGCSRDHIRKRLVFRLAATVGRGLSQVRPSAGALPQREVDQHAEDRRGFSPAGSVSFSGRSVHGGTLLPWRTLLGAEAAGTLTSLVGGTGW